MVSRSASWIGTMLANVGHYAIFLWVIRTALSQGPAQLTFSSNPVCNGENVTLTWSYPSQLPFLQLTVEAYDGTLQKGYLFYQSIPHNLTGSGVFAGKMLNGWPTIPNTATSFSMTLRAIPSLELNYNCSFDVYDNVARKPVTLTSTAARLLVHVSPLPLTFIPSAIVFNDSDSGIIACESRNGKPAAGVTLTVSRTSGGPLALGSGIDSASVTLSSWSLPLSKWHNALVLCRVTNNHCTNFNVTSDVRVNYVTNTSVPDVFYSNESVVLNCSKYISYYPGVEYSWIIPPAANVTGSMHVEWITVPQEQIGSFYCTAINNVTRASVVIVFTRSNSSRTAANLGSYGCVFCWIIGLILGIVTVVIIAVFLSVLWTRGHFQKGRKLTSDFEIHHPGVSATERSHAAESHSVDREYDSLDSQKSSEPTYSPLVLEPNSNTTTLYENFKAVKR